MKSPETIKYNLIINFHYKYQYKNINKHKTTCEITKQKTTLNGKLFSFFNITKIIQSCKNKNK